jgi:hypothetical protein
LRGGVKSQLHETGAVVLRGFDLTKTADGFQQMYLALGLEPCDDPLQVGGLVGGCRMDNEKRSCKMMKESDSFASLETRFLLVHLSHFDNLLFLEFMLSRVVSLVFILFYSILFYSILVGGGARRGGQVERHLRSSEQRVPVQILRRDAQRAG